jgi:hypothetical protein
MTVPPAPQPPVGQPIYDAPPVTTLAPAKFSGLAMASLILGIVGIVFSAVPILDVLTMLGAIVGIILAFVAVFGSRPVLALIGGGLCVLAVVFTAVVLNNFSAAVDKAVGPAPSLAPLPAPVGGGKLPAPATSAPPVASSPATSFGEGTYVVGTDIAPGTYRTAGPASDGSGSCYWEREKNTSGDFGSIIANNLGRGPATVTISRSDGAFKTTGCDTWHKVR